MARWCKSNGQNSLHTRPSRVLGSWIAQVGRALEPKKRDSLKMGPAGKPVNLSRAYKTRPKYPIPHKFQEYFLPVSMILMETPIRLGSVNRRRPSLPLTKGASDDAMLYDRYRNLLTYIFISR